MANPPATFLGALRGIRDGIYSRVAKFAGYSAASPTNTTRAGSRLGLNANTSTAGLQRLGMSFTADMICKDNPLCTAYLTQRQNYCSSTLIYLPGTSDEGLNKAITEYLHGTDGCGGIFSTMGVDCSMQDAFMRTADLETPVKGDAALVNCEWYEEMRLMEVSADQIGEIFNFQPIRKCSLERKIYRDAKGNIERIEIKECAGNDCTYYAGRYFRGPDCVAYKILERQEHWYGNATIYDAADVHYFRDPASYRGYRGITLFHTALPYMQKSDDLLTAALGIAQRQARDSAYIFNNSGQANGTEFDTVIDPNTGRITYIENTAQGPAERYFFNGDSITPNAPTAPGTDVINGIESSDERVALGLRMTFAFLINGSKMGGVVARGDTQKVWKEFSRIQNTIHRPRLNRIKNQSLMNAVRRGTFDIPRGMTSDEFLRGRWMLPTSPVTDAFNDSKAMIDEVREGLIAPQDAIAQTNRDYRDIIRKGGEWRELVELEAWERTKNLREKGCPGIVSAQEISATSDNPQAQAASENLIEGKPASGENKPQGEAPAKPATAALAFDDSEKRDDSGKWTGDGGHGEKRIPANYSSLKKDERKPHLERLYGAISAGKTIQSSDVTGMEDDLLNRGYRREGTAWKKYTVKEADEKPVGSQDAYQWAATVHDDALLNAHRKIMTRLMEVDSERDDIEKAIKDFGKSDALLEDRKHLAAAQDSIHSKATLTGGELEHRGYDLRTLKKKQPATATMAEWDESAHKRGQPGNAGEFGPGGGSSAKKDAPSKSGTEKSAAPKQKSNRPPPAKAAPACDERCQRAKSAHVMVDKTIQRYAEEHNEPKVAKALGGISFPNGEPIDIAIAGDDGVVKHGVELKTMVKNSNGKITMKGDAIARKRSWERKNKAQIHTVVIDDSAVMNAKGDGKHDESKRKIYYASGYGSFRIGSLHEVKGGWDEVKTLINTPYKKLPEAAKKR